MENFAELYADTLRFTVTNKSDLHCWFSADTSYLPIKCGTVKSLKSHVTAIRSACVAAGNASPTISHTKG